jgi:hypothetical protein
MVKKFYSIIVLAGLLMAGSIVAKPVPDNYFTKYEIMDIDFLRSHYAEIENGRAIQVSGFFSSDKWLSPFMYKQRLSFIGYNVEDYNIIQMTLKEKDDFHYSFPLLLFHTQIGELKELQQLESGEEVVIYGKFFNLKKSEYALEVDLIETVNKGGHDRDILIDCRISPTPTVTATITPTPGLSLWQKINNMINPKETITPTGTVTPEATMTK